MRGRLAAVAVLVASSAQAYVLYHSPEHAEVPLRWAVPTATFVFSDTPPEELVASAAESTITGSFGVWAQVLCSDGKSGFTFNTGGVVSGRTVGFAEDEGATNENLVVWVGDSWSHQRSVVALTSLTYDVHTGEIVDADIELNDRDFAFSTTPRLQEMDLENTAVHEIGHFLGLDHSLVPAATMNATALPAETKKRDLTQDDIDGFCALYGPDAPAWPIVIGTPTTAGCTESHNSDGVIVIDCQTPADKSATNGCTAQGRSAPMRPLLLVVLGAGLLLALGRRGAAQRRVRVLARLRRKAPRRGGD